MQAKKVAKNVVKNKTKDIANIENNIELFHKGINFKSYEFMGAHCASENRRRGVRFTTWAPKASEVYVVGDFSEFKPLEEYKMKKISDLGIWSLFIPGIKVGVKYKYFVAFCQEKYQEFSVKNHKILWG